MSKAGVLAGVAAACVLVAAQAATAKTKPAVSGQAVRAYMNAILPLEQREEADRATLQSAIGAVVAQSDNAQAWVAPLQSMRTAATDIRTAATAAARVKAPTALAAVHREYVRALRQFSAGLAKLATTLAGGGSILDALHDAKLVVDRTDLAFIGWRQALVGACKGAGVAVPAWVRRVG